MALTFENAKCPFCKSPSTVKFERPWPGVDPTHDTLCLSCNRTWNSDKGGGGRRRRAEVPG